MTKRTDRIMRTRIRLERAHRLASFNRKISTLLAAILLLCLASGPNGTTANPRGQFAPAVGQNLANQTSNAISMLLKQSQASACDGEQLEIKCDDDYVIEIITAELTILHREHHKHASSNNNRKQQQDDNKVTTTSTTTSAAQPPEATSSRATSAGTRAQEEGSSSPGNHQSGPPPSGGPVAVASAGPTQSTTQESQQRQLESSASNIICPRLDYAGGASRGSVPTTRDSSGSSQTGNGASQMVDAGSMTTAPLEGVCNETEALEASGERKAKFLMLVRKHCSLHKSCSIDLRLGEASNWQPRTTSGEEASNLARTASAVSVGGSNSESNRLSPSSLVAGGQSSIGQFLSEKCPMNRKLVELAYKCRPRVFRSKATCRGAQVTLNCSEPGKVLAIGSAHYGPWPEDKKNNDRCLLEEQSQQRQQNWPTTTTTASSNKPISISTPKSNCTNNPTLALSVLARECLFKHQCQFQVQPGLFSTCPLVDSGGSQYQNNNQQQQQLPDYLKVAYLCVNEEQLITTNSSFLQRQLALTLKDYQSPSLGTTGDGKQDRQQASSSFVSQNVSSSSLRGSVSPQQQFITPPANFGTGLLTPNPEPSNSNQSLRSYVPSITTTTENRAQQPYQPDELSLLPAPNDIGKLIEAYPSLGGKPPSEWTAGERVQFVLRRYEKFLIAFAVITISVSTLLALVARFACGPRSTRQSNASSSTSSKSSSSSSSVQKSFGSSSSSSSSTNCTNQTACTATMSSQQQQHLGVSIGGFNSLAMGHQHHLLAAHQNNYSKPPPTNQMMHQLATGPPQPANNHNHHHQHKLQPTNSCSESCFSLDDCNCPQQQQQQTGGGSGKHLTFQQHHMDTPLNNNSPALQSNQTTPPIEVSSLGNCHQEHQQQQQHHNGQLQQQAAGWTTSTLTAGGARPKLWSFYVNEQHSNSMRLGSSSSYGGAIQQQQQQQQQQHMANFNNAATLRAQRTFSGQPQPALARNFECLQRQDGNQVMLGAPPSLEPHQNDYLLTMASVGQQQQLGGGHPTPSVGESGWCPHSGLGQITDNAGEQRLHLVTLNPAELMESGGGHHHHNPQSLTLYAPTEPGS